MVGLLGAVKRFSVMIHGVHGNPGGGKGLWIMDKIVEELRYGRRWIVTNFPVYYAPWDCRPVTRENLLDLLLKRFGETFGVAERIWKLSDLEMRMAFLHRSPLVPVMAYQNDARGRPMTCDWSGVKDEGVLYIYHEAAQFFGARDWQDLSPLAKKYFEMHRHLGDDIYLDAQKAGQLDKAVRLVMQDFTYMRNYGYEQWGWFAKPKKFRYSTYMRPADIPGPMDRPNVTGTFELDKELAQCYETSAMGLVKGRAADKNSKHVRGIPLKYAWVD